DPHGRDDLSESAQPRALRRPQYRAYLFREGFRRHSLAPVPAPRRLCGARPENPLGSARGFLRSKLEGRRPLKTAFNSTPSKPVKRLLVLLTSALAALSGNAQTLARRDVHVSTTLARSGDQLVPQVQITDRGDGSRVVEVRLTNRSDHDV